jgi:hypothetical protein
MLTQEQSMAVGRGRILQNDQAGRQISRLTTRLDGHTPAELTINDSLVNGITLGEFIALLDEDELMPLDDRYANDWRLRAEVLWQSVCARQCDLGLVRVLGRSISVDLRR